MRPSLRHAITLPSFLVAGLLGGCGDGASGPRGSVNGKVTYEGKPIEVGYLNFLPADGNGPTQATEIVDGEYQISGVTPGKKRLKVQTGGTDKVYSNPAPTPVVKIDNEVPADALGNNQEVEIKAGSQTIDMTLRRPGGAPKP